MVSVHTHLYGGNNLFFVYSLPLTTLQRYYICAAFPANIFLIEKSFQILYYIKGCWNFALY